MSGRYTQVTFYLFVLCAFALAGRALADVKNIFEPKVESSESITAYVLSCMDSLGKQRPDTSTRLRLKYCSCMGDIQRTSGHAPSIPETKRCVEWAMTVKNIRAPSDSPFFNHMLKWSTERIVSGVLECSREALARMKEYTAIAFCACLLDAARAKKTLSPKRAISLVTKQEMGKCWRVVTARVRATE